MNQEPYLTKYLFQYRHKKSEQNSTSNIEVLILIFVTERVFKKQNIGTQKSVINNLENITT